MKFALLLVGILVIAGCQAVPEDDSMETPPEPPIPGTAPVIDEADLFEEMTEVTLETVTSAELATRNSRNDCWVAYEGIVYDVTEWISQHPGGANAIIQHCGTAEQFENALNRQHGDRQITMLKEFTVMGELEQ